MNLARSLGSVGGLTLVSRILALVRDTLQASYVGASFASDAFFVAFRLPNMFRALFAEGAFSAAFIPMFNRKVGEADDVHAGLRFAEQTLAVLLPVLLVFTAIMLLAAWPITWGLSGGFKNPTHEQFAFAVMLSRITIPYLMLISLAGLGDGAVQVNLAVSTALAGGLLNAGSISYIYYADRLNQLPLGLIGIGLGTILLPTISRQLSQKRDAEAMDTQNRGVELALFLTLPATIAFVFAPEPIIRGLFEHGRFTALDTLRCSWALSAFSLGLPSYVLVKVLTPGYYARHDTKTPVRYAVQSVGVNLVGNLILIPTLGRYGYGHVGPPLATAIASTINVWMLYHTLKKRDHFHADAQLRRRVPR